MQGPLDYARCTHENPWTLIRLAHRRRYLRSANLIGNLKPGTFLDWGTGDGHLFHVLNEKGVLPPEAFAFEPNRRLAPQLSRLPINVSVSWSYDEIASIAETRQLRFDVITCLGVLEHLPLRFRLPFYDFVNRFLDDTGTCIVELPIESGLTLIIKEAARTRLMGRRRENSVAGLLRGMVGLRYRDPNRWNEECGDDVLTFHAGFDHRLCRDELESRFIIKRTQRTPFPFLPAGLNQSVILSLGKRIQ